MRRTAVLAAIALAGACASAPERRPEPPRDRTSDPEFTAAREAARPDFASQADVLAAGVYERFVHPDSVRPVEGPARAPAVAPGPVRADGDPSTAELLGTLGGPPAYELPAPEPSATPSVGVPVPPAATAAGGWTLQVGAYATETGALVRISQIERDFPDRPRWHEFSGGLVRVFLGRFPDRAAAERFLAEARARGYGDSFAVRAP
ncbi:MAG TPA: SPOR domain-containing protein [Gemmatimonadota bacterium]|nr:SPOR domain-containing protein [Gemmatimonadota bacterium]